MLEGLSDSARQVIAFAMQVVYKRQHDFISEDHLMLAIIMKGGVATKAIRNCGVDPNYVRREIEKRVGVGSSTPVGQQIPFAPRTKNAINKAAEEAQDLGHIEIGPEHLFLGLLSFPGEVTTAVFNDFKLITTDLHAKVLSLLRCETSEHNRILAGQAKAPSQSDEFIVIDESGTTRVRVWLMEKTTPSIALYDSNGVERASLRLDSEGAPIFELKAKDGSVVFRAP